MGSRFQQIRTHSRPQTLCLSNVDHLCLGILVHVHAGAGGECPNFLLKIHEKSVTKRELEGHEVTRERSRTDKILRPMRNNPYSETKFLMLGWSTRIQHWHKATGTKVSLF